MLSIFQVAQLIKFFFYQHQWFTFNRELALFFRVEKSPLLKGSSHKEKKKVILIKGFFGEPKMESRLLWHHCENLFWNFSF